MNQSNNIRQIRRNATTQGANPTCWFHAMWNPFLITAKGKLLLRIVLKHYVTSVFPTRNLRNESATREYRFWSIINTWLGGGSGLRLNTGGCSVDVIKLFFTNYNPTNTLWNTFSGKRLPQIINFTILKYVTAFYKGNVPKSTNQIPVSGAYMIFRTGIKSYANLAHTFHGLDLNHVVFYLRGNQSRPNLGRSDIAHSVSGIIVNGRQYIVDSGVISGRPALVEPCDWMSNPQNVITSIQNFRNRGYHTCTYEYAVYIKKDININDAIGLKRGSHTSIAMNSIYNNLLKSIQNRKRLRGSSPKNKSASAKTARKHARVNAGLGSNSSSNSNRNKSPNSNRGESSAAGARRGLKRRKT